MISELPIVAVDPSSTFMPIQMVYLKGPYWVLLYLQHCTVTNTKSNFYTEETIMYIHYIDVINTFSPYLSSLLTLESVTATFDHVDKLLYNMFTIPLSF